MPKIIFNQFKQTSRDELIKSCLHYQDRYNNRFAYLVPTTQMKEQIEYKFYHLLKEASNLSVTSFISPPVFLFSGFVNELLKELGVYQRELLSYQRKMILKKVCNKLLQEGKIIFFANMLSSDGFYSNLLKWLKETKNAELDPERWLNLNVNLQKERELGYIFEKYEDFLDSYSLTDQERNYCILIDQIQKAKNRSFTNNSNITFLDDLELIVVDGFYQLNSLQLSLIKNLIVIGKDVHFHINYNPANNKNFPAINKLINRLKKLEMETTWRWEIVVAEQEEIKSDSTVLQHLTQNIFNLSAKKIDCDDSLEIFYAPDRSSEVEGIASKIRQLISSEEELSFTDIAVVVPKISNYRSFITEHFSDFQIPFHLTYELKLTRTPIWRLILKIYNTFRSNWSRESVLELLKSTYLQIAEIDLCDKFETFIYQAGIFHGQDEWYQRIEQLKERIANKTQNSSNQIQIKSDYEQIVILQKLIQEIFQDLNSLKRIQSFTEHCQALLSFLEKYQHKQKIFACQDRVKINRDYCSLLYLKKCMVELTRFMSQIDSDNKRISANDYTILLAEALKEVKIPEQKSNQAAVQIIEPKHSRGQSFKYIFISGLIDGDFPEYKQDNWLFTDFERKKILDQGIFLPQLTDQLEDERKFFLELVSATEKKIFLSSPKLNKDVSNKGSSFIQEVVHLFSDGTIFESVFNQASPVLRKDKIDEAFLTQLFALDTKDANTILDDNLLDLSDIDLQRINKLYQRARNIKLRHSRFFTSYDGMISDGKILNNLNERFNAKRSHSISQINEYAQCPFKFFCKRILNLAEVKEPILRLEALDFGNLFHQILFQFYREFPGWEEEKLESALVRLQNTANSIFENSTVGFHLTPDLWEIYQNEIYETLEQLIIFEYDEAKKQGYHLKPSYFEVSFGLKEEYQEAGTLNYSEPLIIRAVNANEEPVNIKFAGKIDRIDLTQDGKYMIIYDYKLGGRSGFSEIENGLDLQLPIYVKAAQMIFGPEIKILGAGYFSLLKCDRKSGMWQNGKDDLIPVSKRSKSYLDSECWSKMLTLTDEYILAYLQQIRTGVFRVLPRRPCPEYCEFKAICRFQATRISLKKVDQID